jgi:hypothetical protein
MSWNYSIHVIEKSAYIELEKKYDQLNKGYLMVCDENERLRDDMKLAIESMEGCLDDDGNENHLKGLELLSKYKD